LYRQSETVKKL